MADLSAPVVSFVLKNIGRLLAEEARFLGGVGDQAQQLQAKLRLLLSLLRDADLRQDERAVFREWISQIKEVAYDAEDALETFAFRVASRKRKGIANFLKRYSCILSECFMRHRVGSEIQNLQSRISDLTKSFQEYGISARTEEGSSSRGQPLFRRTYSHVEEDGFIGLDNDVEMLVQKLTNEHEESPKSVASICRLHDLMRDLCLAKAKDENFAKVVDYGQANINPDLADSSSSSSKCQRIAIILDPEGLSKYVPPTREMVKHVRFFTFRIFGMEEYDGRMASTKFNNMKMLRVLTIEGMSPCPTPVKVSDCIYILNQIFKLEIGNLIHLRYLCLRKSIFLLLPSSLVKLEHLETLDLRGADISLVRNVLWKMTNLRHLYLYHPDEGLGELYDYLPRCCKLQLSCLTKLETLVNLNSEYCVLEDLCTLGNIQVLQVLKLSSKKDCEEIINFISTSQRLKEVRVHLEVGDDFLNSEKWLALLEKLFCSKLSHLCLEGPLRVLPEYKIHFFQNLSELELRRSRINTNLMGTLEKLPNLQSLWLSDSAFVGTEIICSSVGFPQLTFLLLVEMRNLREWRVENGGMPNLSCLQIDYCAKLDMIPDGLQFLRKLKELEISFMPRRFCDRIRNISGEEGEDFHKVRHVPSIVMAGILS